MGAHPSVGLAGRTSPLISVIIPVRDDLDGLRWCLTALSAQTMPQNAFEVVVVDDGSRVPVGGVVAAFPFARLLQRPAGGSYVARNAGVERSSGALLAFTDADCRPDRSWLAEGAAALDGHQRVGLVGGRVDVCSDDPGHETAVELYELHHGFPQRTYVEHHGFAVTANAFIRRELFQRLGGFDERLRSGGDRDFGRRVRAAGFEVAYAPRAVVAHPARRTWTELLRKMDRVAEGYAQIRHREAPRRAPLWSVVQRGLPPVRTCLRAVRSPMITGPRAWLRYCLAITAVRYMWLILPLRRAVTARTGRTGGSAAEAPVPEPVGEPDPESAVAKGASA